MISHLPICILNSVISPIAIDHFADYACVRGNARTSDAKVVASLMTFQPRLPRWINVTPLKDESAYREGLLYVGKDRHRKLRDRVQGAQEGTCGFSSSFLSLSKRFRLGSNAPNRSSGIDRLFVIKRRARSRVKLHVMLSLTHLFRLSSPTLYNSPEGKYALSPETR